MKTAFRFRDTGSRLFLALCFVLATIGAARAQSFVVRFWYPTNGQAFTAPASIGLHALATDSNVIETMQYYSGATLIGTVTNKTAMLLTNLTQDSPFYMAWSNVPAGGYTLTAVGWDSLGNTATSAPVNITVSNAPPPVIRPVAYIYSPTNYSVFLAPANLNIYARATESTGQIASVQFFANNVSLGVVPGGSQMVFSNISIEPLFPFAWSNVVAGNYALKVLATDTNGNTATSSVVNISVVTNIPPPVTRPSVAIYSPTNGSKFTAPVNVNIYARAAESTGTVATVQFFANNISLGVVSNSSEVVVSNISSAPLFPLTWPNAPPGYYYLTAIATDTSGNSATSSVVSISILTNSPPPPPVPFAISLFAPTNGQTFAAPANIYVHAAVTDSNLVRFVQYFAGTTSIGIRTNTSSVLLTNTSQANSFALYWTNVLAGSYTLTAVAFDSAGNTATSGPVNITVTNVPPPIVPFTVSFWYPTNGQTFAAPANIGVHARVTDSNVVEFVQYYSGSALIGTVSNLSGILLTNSTQGNPFYLVWSNVLAGNYALTAVASDSAGNTATSGPVNITVTNVPPPIIPFVVSFAYPVNGQTFAAPANIYLHARVSDSNLVESVQYFSGSNSLGIVSNKTGVLLTNTTSVNPFYLIWSNVPAGSYTLTAVALDSAGNTATSGPVNITVTNVPPPIIPFAVSFFYPTNGQMFAAPANVGVHARVTDSNVVEFVQYWANGSSIGVVSNTGGLLLTNSTEYNPFFLDWSNVPAGDYTLTAVATDSTGNTATSGPVLIHVLTNLPPVVTIYAPDPVAIEGTNYQSWFTPATSVTNYIGGTNTATFLVRRDSQTNVDLTVNYSIGGTASNGVDYATIPNYVVIPSGQRYALITIVPLPDNDSSYRRYDTVVLALTQPTNFPPSYVTGSPSSAGAVILEENFLPIPKPLINNMADNSMHVSLPATNGMNFCLQISTDLVNWLPVCTNTVLKGSAQFVDPNLNPSAGLYYRIVPVGAPASY